MDQFISDMQKDPQTRTYDRYESIVFLKTKEAFGGLSNMASGYPLKINGVRILTSEALYQACRFPHLPDVQKLIISQTSPMTAKMKSKPYRKDSREDWNRVRTKVMRWCLRVKLAQNWEKFSELLLATGDKPIVEESRKDDFWGAHPIDECTLTGKNILGRLLMELREQVKTQSRDSLLRVEPLNIPEFLFMDKPVLVDSIYSNQTRASANLSREKPQSSLFETSVVKEASANYPVERRNKEHISRNLSPYKDMKDSNEPSLGLIPARWSTRRLKYLLRERDSRSSDGSEQLLKVSQFTGVTERKRAGGGDEPDTRAESLVGYKHVEPNHLAVNIMLAWNGSMGVSRYSGIVSPAYCVYRFNETANPWYYHYLLRSPAYKAIIKAASKGVVDSRLRLYTDDLYRIVAPLPPVAEQDAIVRFLDHVNRKIQRYIRAKQKLIKLLEEQKQVIIHRAVTRGLEPNVRMKPSGEEWLGDVPEHWEIWQIGHFAVVGNGSTPSRGNSSYWTNGTYPWLNSSSVNASTITTSNQFVTETALRQCHLPRVPAGSVLVAITGQGKTRGRAAVLRIEATLNQHLAFITLRKPDEIVTAEYLHKFLVAAYSELRSMSDDSGSTKGALTCEDLRHFRVAIPPISTQREIVRLINGETAEVERAAQVAQCQIDLLHEYRTNLIADVVTGKLDVRKAASCLPDEIEEAESLDDTEGEADDTGDDEIDEVLEEAET